ncbi:AsmA2 domain-containing protein [Photorhabdus akhurstii]|nr:AsmA2 domain-containing protein [Photorhabdus akhurstii]
MRVRRLPGVLLATAAIVIIIVALLVSGLRFLLPHINDYRPQLFAKIESIIGVPIDAGYIAGEWESFGPVFELRDIGVKTANADVKAKKITVALDIWLSLLRMRWNFRDLTFYQLQVDYHQPLFNDQSGNMFSQSDLFSELFLEQFDHFNLQDSRFTFLTPSGERADLLLPQLTWLNKDNRHRAQGKISLSSINNQHGDIQVKFDLHDTNGVLDNGTIYLQADNVDIHPWLSHWLQDNTGLKDAEFSLSSWIMLKEGRIDGGQLQLRQGEANWKVANKPHNLSVSDLVFRMRRQDGGWLFDAPELANLITDGQQWPSGKVSVLYLPEAKRVDGHDHWRVRAKNIQLERLSSILPTFSFLTSDLVKDWQRRQPQGLVKYLALDITPKMADDSRISVQWQNVSWQRWQKLPSIDNFSGSLNGSLRQGRLSFALKDSVVDYRDMFLAPFEISQSHGEILWRQGERGLQLWSQGLDLQGKSLWVNGDFRYQQPKEQPPALSILAGVRVYDAGDAWRYFPEPLMGTPLTDYLTASIIKGQIENATFVFQGNPKDFPFVKNNGQFQVFAPLRHATFQYQPNWPALLDLNIDLNFQNNGLWMLAPQTALGKVKASNLSAVIPNYRNKKLLIDADILGDGKDIHEYFTRSPLAHSVGETLETLQVGGQIAGNLHLDIPLNGGNVDARGEVTLKNNHLLIKPLDSEMKNVSGRFRFNNGNLQSGKLSAQWFGQPVTVDFSTENLLKNYRVNVGLNARWAIAKLSGFLPAIAKVFSGSVDWEGKIGINLPFQSKPQYDVKIDADLSQVDSYLSALKADELRALHILADGDMEQLRVKGILDKQYAFNTQWRLAGKNTQLSRGILQSNSNNIPDLPEKSLLELNLPAIEGEEWLGLIAPLTSGSSLAGMSMLPQHLYISLPSLDVGGQRWNQLSLDVEKQFWGTQITANSREINGKLNIRKSGPWQMNLNYLYYNPLQYSAQQAESDLPKQSQTGTTLRYSLNQWPSLDIICSECWIMGLKLGKVSGSLIPEGNSLVLRDGIVENSASKLNLAGRWQEGAVGNNTHIMGQFSGEKFDEMASYLGIVVPIVNSPFTFRFDFNWWDTPWKPNFQTLNGNLKSNLGKGAIEKLGGGGAGQLLKLVSFDALLRKLQLDFSDTFSQDFEFDSIRGDVSVKNGILKAENLRVDGLIADVITKGEIDLVRQQINIEAIVTPEISATVGVATAFVINPMAGAALFAATKVLGPLWNKISVIRYRITGNLEQPKIDEVLRQLKENRGT